ncbi:S-layer protein [Secundilactobacillus paracollinoides]|uniref:S-layer protein n=1 Tax=Secundilactobacillus paracollinoides TaxID=240427 RepID=A0A1B2J2K3_9LACO|nr:S-layer protein [Secundilactobacillus paracollinoides]ANZ68536.1 S-layer protein [Secundilactobacillus paracollinoides]
MRKSLAKSIYFGAAALAFAGIVGTTSTTASAKSYATAGAYTALTTGKNVVATGSNAIYSKPGTVKGAKVVASKATVAKLAASKSSADTLYAYATKTTNKGSVYYKVVTMDKKYRGYIYGGKSTSTVAGGIKTTDTTTTAATPARTTGYYLKDASKNTLWTAPKNTDINAKKVSLYGAAKTDPFTVDKAATTTKEGYLYYHVTDSKDPSISGWIYAGKGYDTTITDSTKQDLGGLSLNVAEDAATADNSVKVVYCDANNNNAQVSVSNWVNAPKSGDAATKAGDTVATTAVNSANVKLADFINNSVPANYKISGDVPAATYGNTVYVNVVAAATSKVQLRVDSVNNNVKAKDAAEATEVKLTSPLAVGTKLSSSEFAGVLNSDAIKALSGSKGTAIGDTNLTTIKGGFSNTPVEGTTTYTTSDGTPYHYQFTFEPANFNSDNRTANYGDTLTASFSAQLVTGAANKTASDSSWIA